MRRFIAPVLLSAAAFVLPLAAAQAAAPVVTAAGATPGDIGWDFAKPNQV